jgi:hypothetical protein
VKKKNSYLEENNRFIINSKSHLLSKKINWNRINIRFILKGINLSILELFLRSFHPLYESSILISRVKVGVIGWNKKRFNRRRFFILEDKNNLIFGNALDWDRAFRASKVDFLILGTKF